MPSSRRFRRRVRAYFKYARTAETSDASTKIALRMLTPVDAEPTMDAGIQLAEVGEGVGVGDAAVGVTIGARVTAGVGRGGALGGVAVTRPGALGIFKIIPVRKRVVVVMSLAFAINGYFEPLPYTFCAIIQSESPD